MNNIEFLDAAIKAYGEIPKIKLLSTGVEMTVGGVTYGGNTLNDCVQDMREAFSEAYVEVIKERFQSKSHD
jgi:hypothetical protein